MPLSPYYLFIIEKRPDVVKSIEKAHVTETAKLEKTHMREIAHKLTDTWLKLDPDSKKEYEKRNTAMNTYCRSALGHF